MKEEKKCTIVSLILLSLVVEFAFRFLRGLIALYLFLPFSCVCVCSYGFSMIERLGNLLLVSSSFAFWLFLVEFLFGLTYGPSNEKMRPLFNNSASQLNINENIFAE